MAGHVKKTNLKCQATLSQVLEFSSPRECPADNDEGPHGLVYDVSSIESDTKYKSTGHSIHDEDDVPTAETVNDET